jgi:hypothetical protein
MIKVAYFNWSRRTQLTAWSPAAWATWCHPPERHVEMAVGEQTFLNHP